MRTLYSCRPHYIRCIKPNSFKQAINFDKALVTDQVRYLGLLEVMFFFLKYFKLLTFFFSLKTEC